MTKDKILRGIVALIFGPLIGFGVGGGLVAISYVPDIVMMSTFLLISLAAIAYLYLHTSLVTAVQDGFYGLGIATGIFVFLSNADGGESLIAFLLAGLIGLVLAGIGYGIHYIWGDADSTNRSLRVSPDLPDNRITAWLQWWKLLFIAGSTIVLVVWSASDGITSSPPQFIRGLLGIVLAITLYTLAATAIWRVIRKVASKMRS